MSFDYLDKQLELFIDQLNNLDLLDTDKIKSTYSLNIFNTSTYLVTLHDVETYKPIFINNKMRDFYGFKSNHFKGINYLYYLKTIHVSTYSSLLTSISFFRKDNVDKLNLNYKLRYKNKEWRSVIGSSKTIIRKANGKPKYAITLAKEGKHTSSNHFLKKIKELTNKEKEIATLLRNGMKNDEISNLINISEHTLHTHLKNIYKKLGISKTAELIVLDKHFIIPGIVDKEKFNTLSKREIQIIELLAIGLTKKEVSLCLSISESTVHSHSKNIFKKLNISNIKDLMSVKQTTIN